MGTTFAYMYNYAYIYTAVTSVDRGFLCVPIPFLVRETETQCPDQGAGLAILGAQDKHGHEALRILCSPLFFNPFKTHL